MRALAASRRNPVALTNLGAFFGKEVTACGLSTICTSPSRISQVGEGCPKAICQSGNISTPDRFIIGR
jgi:hypothetical protein